MEELVKKAIDGDKNALNQLVKKIQDPIYNLALRMLWHPEDAKDATQEILIRIVTKLSTFKQESSFKTWSYRVAANSLINFRKKQQGGPSFSEFEQQLHEGFQDTVGYTSNKAEQNLLIQEAKIGCSQAMLQCISGENRLVYILGEILDFNSKEGAHILGISPESFRKKLSRTRTTLHQFVRQNCGLISKEAPCRCHKKVDHAIEKRRINPNNLLFVTKEQQNLIHQIDSLENEVALFQSNPRYAAPEELRSSLQFLMDGEG